MSPRDLIHRIRSNTGWFWLNPGQLSRPNWADSGPNLAAAGPISADVAQTCGRIWPKHGRSQAKLTYRFHAARVPFKRRWCSSSLPLTSRSRADYVPLACSSCAGQAPLKCRSSAAHLPLTRHSCAARTPLVTRAATRIGTMTKAERVSKTHVASCPTAFRSDGARRPNKYMCRRWPDMEP